MFVNNILPVLIPGFDHPTRQYMMLTGGEAGWRICRNSLLPAICISTTFLYALEEMELLSWSTKESEMQYLDAISKTTE